MTDIAWYLARANGNGVLSGPYADREEAFAARDSAGSVLEGRPRLVHLTADEARRRAL